MLKERTIKFWDNRAARFDKSARFFEAPPIDKAKKYLERNDVVLDFGCATGTIAHAVAPDVKHVVGIDISPKMIDIAKKKAEELSIANVEFMPTDIFNKELKSGSFDVVLAFNIIHFFADFQPLFHRIYELLKSGGTVIIATSCLKRKGFTNISQYILYKPLIKMGLIPYMRFFTIHELENKLIESGFQIRVVQNLKSNSNYLLIVEKP